MKTTATAVVLVLAATSGVAAQDNIQKLQDFQVTGTSLEIPTIPQEGKKAENLKKVAERIKLPDGFKIELYAVVPDARHMAIGRNVGTVFVGTRKTKVYAVTDRDKDRVADEVKEFAPSVDLKVPNGMCFSPDGFLLRGRAQPGSRLPGRRVLLREPGCRDRRRSRRAS